jgi:hypothetical protein
MQSVKHPESSEIVLVIGCDHYRISLLVVGHKGRIVDLDNSIAGRVHVCELLLEGSCLVDEDDIPFSKEVLGRRKREGGQFDQNSGEGELHTRGEIIIVAIVGPRIKKRVARVGFDEVVSGERRSSER